MLVCHKVPPGRIKAGWSPTLRSRLLSRYLRRKPCQVLRVLQVDLQAAERPQQHRGKLSECICSTLVLFTNPQPLREFGPIGSIPPRD